jgi:WD40 repeat protein
LDVDHHADGRLAILKLVGNSLELWDVAHGSECRYLPRTLFPTLGGIQGAAVSPDSRLLALSGANGLEIWGLPHCRRLATQHGELCSALFDKRGDLIVAWGSGIYRWPRSDLLQTAKQGDAPKKVISFGAPQRLSAIGMPTSLASGTPSQHLVYEEGDAWHSLSLSNPGERIEIRPPGDPRKASLSYDGRLAAIAGWHLGGVSIWDVANGKRLAELATEHYCITDFSPDGQWLATTPGGVQIWKTSDWTIAHELHAHGKTPHGLGIAFSCDSRMLAIGQPNGELRLVDPSSGRDWARIMHPVPASAAIICFTPDHRQLIALAVDGQAPTRVWNLPKLRQSLRKYKLDWPDDVLDATSQPLPDTTPLEVKWQGGSWPLN